jgi:predicted DsbA family dithiol-disulfide isomerase
VAVQWTAFPLHPETPEQGRTLEELFAGRGLDIPQMLVRLEQTAEELGLPFGRRTMTYNSRRAQELGKWAEEQGCGEAFHRAVFHAYFAEGLNIARLDVLRNLAEHVGLDPDRAIEALDIRQYREAVDEDWQRARRLGVNAVPTFQMQGRVLVGAQSYEALVNFVNGKHSF